jgi:glycosyltransferase involved in cell wall biosynthesis
LKDRPSNITRDIIVDLSAFYESGGVMTLTRNLISDIAKRRPNWRFLVLVTQGRKHMYNFPQSSNIKLIEIDNSFSLIMFIERILNSEAFGLFHDKLVQLLYYDLIFCDQNCDLVWDPDGNSSCCNFVTVPRISTVHDLFCFDVSPEFFDSDMVKLRASTCVENAVHFSKKIITVSEFSQKRICDKFHVLKDFVKHIPIKLGARLYSDVDAEKCKNALDKYKLKPQKYFIFCSTWWKNKNHLALMKAFNKFAEKNPEIKLILIGKHPDIFESRPIQEFSSDRIIITGFVPDEDLGILLKNALAFIHPSVYEGFGMPIIEAMANGIPVACSNVSSLPEIAGSAALLFNPFDVDSITQAMHRLADDPLLRKDLIQKGYEQAKKYSDREAMVDEYIRVMEEVMEENDRKQSDMNEYLNELLINN